MAELNNTNLEEAYLTLANDKRFHAKGLHEAASVIASHCATTLSASRVSVWFLSDDKTHLVCQSVYSLASDCIDSGAILNVAEAPDYLGLLRNTRVLSVSDALNDQRTCELVKDHLKPFDIRSLINVGIRHHGIPQGVLSIEMVGARREWHKEEEMFTASVADLLSHHKIFSQLAQSEAKHKALFESSSEGIVVFSGTVFADVNPAICSIFGVKREDIVGKSPVDFSPDFQSDGQPSADKAMTYVMACLAGTPQNFEWIHTRLDGTEFFAEVTLNAVRLANEDTLFAQIRDITVKKESESKDRQINAEIEFRAAHDSLTGLLNRDQLHIHIDNLINSEQNNTDANFEIALMLFDLNRFKEINDTLGHSTGDQVLVKLADVLKVPISNVGGRFFRLGGDEFVAVFDSHSCTQPFPELVEVLTRTMKITLDLDDDINVEMGASIGIALYPDNGKDSQELLRCADVAMYHAKNNDGKSSWYDPVNDLNNKRRLAMMVELGSAIRDDELMLQYQPRINIRTGEVTGCEALLRWQHAKLGMVPPVEFIPLAEMTELIHPLTGWVLANVVLQVKHLQSNGYNVPIAMNVSTRNLTDSQFVDALEKVITGDCINPRLLEIEITESALINHPTRALQNLDRIDKLGVSIAIDDFGTGYSSLSYLKKLPLDTLKIDQSFVNDMLSSDSDSLIVDSTINLAHNFSLTVVAEGVEDQETLDALVRKKCDQAQGYFIARPMSAEALEQWLDEHNNGKFVSSLAA